MQNKIWIIKIVLLAFAISISFSFVSETAIPNVNIILGIIITLIFIIIGVVFDMIGLAVASADISIFNSMASKKINGSKLAIKLIKNADKVSSFCNDVVGDICGIISGSTGVVIAIKLIETTGGNELIIKLLITGIISALTIGGKAIEKAIAIKRSKEITYKFAQFLSLFYRRSV